jgi:hypothetical protein
MGYLIELDPPRPQLRPVRGSRREPARAPRNRVTPPPAREAPRGIEWCLPLIPHVVAESVVEEASVWLGEELPWQWVPRLARRTEVIAWHNPRFRRLLGRPGNAGRDWLWAFMRHWLAALIWRHRPDLHRRLPASYNVGHDLPG